MEPWFGLGNWMANIYQHQSPTLIIHFKGEVIWQEEK